MKAGSIHRGDKPAIAQAWMADRWWQRLRGLLLRGPLAHDGSQALVIKPCASVHTLGMTYALDLVFLDAAQRVCGVRQRVAPWRAAACRGAHAVVELHGGALDGLKPEIGETWTWRPALARRPEESTA